MKAATSPAANNGGRFSLLRMAETARHCVACQPLYAARFSKTRNQNSEGTLQKKLKLEVDNDDKDGIMRE